MNKGWNESTKLNYLMVLGILVCLMFFSMTFYFYNEASASRDDDANSRVMEVSEQYQTTISNQINSDFTTLVGVSSFISRDSLLNENELLNSFDIVIKQNNFLRISFTRIDGFAFMINNSGIRSYQVDLNDRDYIQKALAGNMNLSDSFEDVISNEYVNCYAVPVWDGDTVIGCITAVHKSEHFYNLITSSIFDGEGETNIVNENGDFVIRVYDEEQRSKNLKEKIDDDIEKERLLSSIKNQEKDVFDIEINDEKYISAVVPLGVNDWSVNTVVPMGYFHLGYDRLENIFLITLLLIIVVSIIMLLVIRKIMNENRESIVRLAYYDPLTSMYNRNRFMDLSPELIDTKKAYVFVLLDVNNFKFINETYGYEGGNNLLRHIASVLMCSVDKDEMCFRDSADCFGMLLRFESRPILENRLHRMIDEIGKHHFDENYNVICNCGIKIIEENFKNGKDIDMILDRSIIALNQAKGNHVSTLVYFNEKMEETSQQKFQIENTMRLALDNHEFQMYLQPKVDVKSESIIGSEALVRWVDGDQIKFYPDDFIPIFEENGFVCELDLYMLEEACLCLKNGIEQGHRMLPISVNQSKVLLYRKNYLESLKHILDIYHIDPSLIIIEVTETVTMENLEVVKEVVQGLHDLGFKVSMDDFGSGYSSLNVLQKLDIDELKLDREFLKMNDHEYKQKKIIESVVRLAKELHILTVSEGVETAEQLAYLRSIHCDTAQGYYFSRPIPFQQLMDDMYVHDKWKY